MVTMVVMVVPVMITVASVVAVTRAGVGVVTGMARVGLVHLCVHARRC